MTALDGQIRQLDHATKSGVLTDIAEGIVARRPNESDHLNEYLERLGWQFVDGKLIPIELFDVTELTEIPEGARTDLVKAAARLRASDLGGALAAACAAVDSAANAVYAEQDLAAQSSDGFQTRCMNALKQRT